MTCRLLGDACHQVVHAGSFEDVTELSEQPGLNLCRIEDKPPLGSPGHHANIDGGSKTIAGLAAAKSSALESF